MPTNTGVAFKLADVEDFLQLLNDMGQDKKLANTFTRDRAFEAATGLVPLVEQAVRRSPAPQSAALAGTVRAKRDRMIVVRFGAVKPKLSGMKGRRRGGARTAGTLAWGVAVGPKAHQVRVEPHRRRVPGGRKRNSTYYQVRGFRRAYGNPYRVGRSGGSPDPFSGYLSGVKDDLVERAAELYGEIIVEVVRRAGWPV